MTRISVRLDPALLERGELLAEASAMEAAGVDTLWLPEAARELDGSVLLAALVGSVRGPRFGLELGPQQPGWRSRAQTLQLLCRGRLVLSSGADSLPADPPAPLLVLGMRHHLDVAGFIHPAAAEIEELKQAVSAAPGREHWLQGDGSKGRVVWRRLLDVARDAGLTGIVVPHHPFLLDLLRNPDQEDDRADLQMATG